MASRRHGHFASLEGKPAVLLDVRRQSGTNTVTIMGTSKNQAGRHRSGFRPDST